jgi:hypothetical protein
MPVTSEDIDRNLIAPFEIAMDSEGITISALAKKLKSELNAKKTDTFKAKNTKRIIDPNFKQAPEGEPQLEPKYITIEAEEVIYSRPMVDWKTRAQARKDALAYHNIIAADRVSIEHSGSINYSNLTDEELDARIKEGFNKVYGPQI